MVSSRGREDVLTRCVADEVEVEEEDESVVPVAVVVAVAVAGKESVTAECWR